MAKFRPLAPGQTASSVEQQMGIQFFDGDAGDITSREAGNMVKRMVKYAEEQLQKGQKM
ncbi:MAG TPA: small, acid-soluble spore protein, alpha/beta type [Peptococcaceae bacterium]|nr:small, acid-soluble spore protein, alpha/beta type [Peptococcaceae bacterium]